SGCRGFLGKVIAVFWAWAAAPRNRAETNLKVPPRLFPLRKSPDPTRPTRLHSKGLCRYLKRTANRAGSRPGVWRAFGTLLGSLATARCQAWAAEAFRNQK